MVTIKDVAKRAEVSVATVSRVMRGIGYIGDETRSKVLTAAEQLGYVANASAQRLKNKNLGIVGYIISDINNPYYYHIASDLQNILHKRGSELILAFSSENPVDEEKSFRYLISSQVSAILFTPTNQDNGEIISIARRNGVKVIQMFRKIYDDLDTILNDDENGCYAAARYFIENGYKKILLFDVEYPYIEYTKVVPSRAKGLYRALENSSVSAKVSHLKLIGSNLEEIQKEIQLFAPEAIITATNNFGMEVLYALKQFKNRQISLISFDDNQWFDICNVSAIRQNNENLAEIVCDMIRSHEQTQQTKILSQSLIERKVKS